MNGCGCFIVIIIFLIAMYVIISSKNTHREGYYSMSGWNSDEYRKCGEGIIRENPNCKKCYQDAFEKCRTDNKCLEKFMKYSSACGLCDFDIRSTCGASGYFGNCSWKR